MLENELTDICFNFTHRAYDKKRRAVLDRALDAGVTTMIVTGSTLDESRRALTLAHRYPQFLFATAGVHPHHAESWDALCDAGIRKLSHSPKLVAIGECGLDYYRDLSPRAAQRIAFEAQLAIAAETGLPAFCHQREAHDDFLPIIRAVRKDLSGLVVHCFTGQRHELEAYLELDCHIGITGWICDERRGTHLQDLVGIIPASRLMIETDAPYLLPRDLDPKPQSNVNEPKYLPHIAARIAAARGESVDEVIVNSTRCAREFYALDAA